MIWVVFPPSTTRLNRNSKNLLCGAPLGRSSLYSMAPKRVGLLNQLLLDARIQEQLQVMLGS